MEQIQQYITKVANNKVLITYDANNKAMGLVCTINETTITTGTSVLLNNEDYSGNYMSVVALSENKVCVVFNYRSFSAVVCTINGTVITVNTITQLGTAGRGSSVSAIKLAENKIFIVNSSNVEFYGTVCEINETAITAGTSVLLNSESFSGIPISLTALSENMVFIAYAKENTNFLLYGMTCNIDGITVTKERDKQLSTQNYSGRFISAVAISENMVFIAHSIDSTNFLLYGTIYTLNNEKYVKRLETYVDRIAGVAQTSGTDGQLIKVYVPDYIKEEN